MARAETVVSELLCVLPPVLEAPVLLRALDLVPRPVPAWITDEAVRSSIVDGFIDIPDDLLRGSR